MVDCGNVLLSVLVSVVSRGVVSVGSVVTVAAPLAVVTWSTKTEYRLNNNTCKNNTATISSSILVAGSEGQERSFPSEMLGGQIQLGDDP